MRQPDQRETGRFEKLAALVPIGVSVLFLLWGIEALVSGGKLYGYAAPVYFAIVPVGIVLALAVALRVVVMLGYPPILWFNDSYNYVTDAVTKTPDVVRSNGYPLVLWLLLFWMYRRKILVRI